MVSADDSMFRQLTLFLYVAMHLSSGKKPDACRGIVGRADDKNAKNALASRGRDCFRVFPTGLYA